MADLWQYFEPLKEDPFYLTCTICELKFKGWKRSVLEDHLKTKHNLKVLPKQSDPVNKLPKSANAPKFDLVNNLPKSENAAKFMLCHEEFLFLTKKTYTKF